MLREYLAIKNEASDYRRHSEQAADLKSRFEGEISKNKEKFQEMSYRIRDLEKENNQLKEAKVNLQDRLAEVEL